MATLQKFKLLATQCAVAGSPTRSPSTSPVIHLRRRKTLRMFLSRRLASRDEGFVDRRGRDIDSCEKRKDEGVRRKLKDLLVSSSSSSSSPPASEEKSGLIIRRGGCGSRGVRPLLSGTLRQRLLRRAWRPVLVTIPE
ncbi:hypothetical protein QVD17_04901 [Tagetes erecta]|uniref:Uncharacterized protein n=1 Tax=Tagetes erecta TaxID=13708 RepID=A0AAD8LH64_TARER|nr:hypothetical protein QVD17_04901 [Tagetes erecta]